MSNKMKEVKKQPNTVFDPPHIPDQSTLRDYQAECIQKIEEMKEGSYLIVLPTGSGKTFVFSHIPRHGRVLILSHRDELVHQPEKYYDCSFGVEQAKEHSDGEEVVSASVQSLVRRLKRFDPYDFDMIITDEAHHAVAPSYKKIYNYFKPRIHLGFTATPDRADKADLNKIFDEVLFYKDIKWGISKGYLTDIDCIRVDIGYDLTQARKQMGDFNQQDLSSAMLQPECVDAVAEAYHKYHKGQTVIFCANVEHCNSVAAKIPGSVVVTGQTQNRDQIIKDFTNKKFECLINCMVFTEGTDMPLIETVIMARPTHNQSLYCQAVGRGLRPYPGKEFLNLIDCVGASKMSICSAPTLFGLNCEIIPKKKQKRIKGKLSEMENVFKQILSGPDSWINNIERVSLFEEDNGVNALKLNCVPMEDNALHIPIGNNKTIIIPPTNALGKTTAYIEKREDGKISHSKPMKENDLQTVLNNVYIFLTNKCQDTRILWDADLATKGWGSQKASLKQIEYITRLSMMTGVKLTNIEPACLNKQQASCIIEQLKGKPIINPNPKPVPQERIISLLETSQKRIEWNELISNFPYKIHERVQHPFYGEGEITNIYTDNQKSDIYIEVKFLDDQSIETYSYKEIKSLLKIEN